MRVVHYFSPMSGYAYLGLGALRAMAERRCASIVHKPVDVVRLFAAVDTIAPAKQSPARMNWRRADMARWAKRRGLPLNVQPRHWPINASLASRAIIAAQASGLDASALAEAILSAIWARDLDISNAETLATLAGACGIDAQTLLAMADTPAAQAEFAANTDEAIALGVVGSPTYFVSGEMFFGQDRLDFVEEKLAEAIAA